MTTPATTPAQPTTPTVTPVKQTSTLEAKIVAAIPAILGVVFAIHPGWKQSGLTSGIETAVSELIAGGIYVYNLITSRKVA